MKVKKIRRASAVERAVARAETDEHMRRSDRDAMVEAANNIRDELGRMNKQNVLGAMIVGKELFQIHERISNHGNGRFYAWVEKEFTRTYDLSVKTAERWLRIYARFKEKDSATLSQFTLSALYFLSIPSNEGQHVDLLFAEAEKGNRITLKYVKRVADDLWEMARNDKYPDTELDDEEKEEQRQRRKDDREPKAILRMLKRLWPRASYEEKRKFEVWINEQREAKPPDDG